MQGALFGARSLGTGFGPILFATVFSLFSRTDSPLPYFPGISFPALQFLKLVCCFGQPQPLYLSSPSRVSVSVLHAEIKNRILN